MEHDLKIKGKNSKTSVKHLNEGNTLLTSEEDMAKHLDITISDNHKE